MFIKLWEAKIVIKIRLIVQSYNTVILYKLSLRGHFYKQMKLLTELYCTCINPTVSLNQ